MSLLTRAGVPAYPPAGRLGPNAQWWRYDLDWLDHEDKRAEAVTEARYAFNMDCRFR